MVKLRHQPDIEVEMTPHDVAGRDPQLAHAIARGVAPAGRAADRPSRIAAHAPSPRCRNCTGSM